jgi:hypothetical protein
MSVLPFSKSEVLDACIKYQSDQVDTIKKQLSQILESANDESDGEDEAMVKMKGESHLRSNCKLSEKCTTRN